MNDLHAFNFVIHKKIYIETSRKGSTKFQFIERLKTSFSILKP